MDLSICATVTFRSGDLQRTSELVCGYYRGQLCSALTPTLCDAETPQLPLGQNKRSTYPKRLRLCDLV